MAGCATGAILHPNHRLVGHDRPLFVLTIDCSSKKVGQLLISFVLFILVPHDVRVLFSASSSSNPASVSRAPSSGL